jgi:dTDP-4-dehydrorhamnose reductase
MKKVAVLGSAGMLGRMSSQFLKMYFDVTDIDRSKLQVVPRTLNETGIELSKVISSDTDYVLNCIGAIKPTFNAATDLSNPLFVNAIFPYQLSCWCTLMGIKLIHITTDCVFDGLVGKYTEDASCTATDMYGLSKSLGEPEDCMVIRTSIIGPEFDGRSRSFLSWVKSQKGGKANGYTNHSWNGLTTLELSNLLSVLIDDNIWEAGTFHLFSNDVSKFEMLSEINDQYSLGIDITPVEAPQAIDRTLRTVKNLNNYLRADPFEMMVADMIRWENA